MVIVSWDYWNFEQILPPLNLHISGLCYIIFSLNIQGVAVPFTRVPISEEDYEELELLIDPLAESENYGIDLYQETLHFLNEHAET